MKHCTKCGQEKVLDEFPKRKDRKDGLGSWCKECKYKKVFEWKSENPHLYKDYQKDYQRVYRPNHCEERKVYQRQYQKQYQKDHSEKYVKRQKSEESIKKAKDSRRKRYTKNAEKIRLRNNAWAKANPEKRQEHKRNRRAREKGVGGKITSQEWKWLKEFYNYTCLSCRRSEPEIELTLDHVVPIKLGGKNVISNAQPLCRSCNSSKGINTTDYRENSELNLFT